MAGGSTKAIVAAAAANGGLAVAKFTAFAFTGSSSMLAEGIHSVADTSNQGLLLLGGKRSTREATPTHEFGYGRERYFWSFVVAMVLFSVGGLFALYEGWHKLSHIADHPEETLSNPEWAIGVLTFGILLEFFSFRTAIVESRKVKGDQGWWSFIRHSRSPELPVVLLEDAGAMLGLVLALCGVGLALLTGDLRWDAWGTMSIGALLSIIAIILTVEMKSLLLGESAVEPHRLTIEAAITAVDAIDSIVELKTTHIGPDTLLIAGKVRFGRADNFTEVSAAIDEAEAAIRAAVPLTCHIYLEPGLAASTP